MVASIDYELNISFTETGHSLGQLVEFEIAGGWQTSSAANGVGAPGPPRLSSRPDCEAAISSVAILLC